MFPYEVGLFGGAPASGEYQGSDSVPRSRNAYEGLKSRIQSGCTVDRAKEGSG